MPSEDELLRERFLVELDQGPRGCDPALLTRLARDAAEADESGAPVRHVRTIYVPEDGSSYLLMEARSAVEVEDALRMVGLEVRSVEPAIQAAVGSARQEAS